MDRIISVCAIAAGSLLGSVASADMVKIADSLQEFSGIQGVDGWSYGWYADADIAHTPGFAAVNTANFQEFEYYAPGSGWWTHDSVSASSGAGGSPYFLTVVTADAMHANAPIPGSHEIADDIRWASRRWTSEISGTIDIIGHIAKMDQGSLLGDGIDAYVIIDGISVFYYGVEVGDYTGTDFSLSATVTEGSVVEFIVGSRQSGLFDAVSFRSEIYGQPVPTPGALALLGAGGLLAGRRRR
ncbi:MAG: hypothetical protein D6692_10620 [Planctomycetota bacterium]|nr:MAG: hypothetical protein D6692_10620 [Planctomycetota bacterium]